MKLVSDMLVLVTCVLLTCVLVYDIPTQLCRATYVWVESVAFVDTFVLENNVSDRSPSPALSRGGATCNPDMFCLSDISV